MNNQHNLEHHPLRAYVYICVYNTTTRSRSLRFGMEFLNRFRALLLELSARVRDSMVASQDGHGPKTENLTTSLLPRPPNFLIFFFLSFLSPIQNFINWFKLVHRTYPFKVTCFQVNMGNLSKNKIRVLCFNIVLGVHYIVKVSFTALITISCFQKFLFCTFSALDKIKIISCSNIK